MLFPFNTTAPLYHYPIATVALIVVNVLLFVAWPPFDSPALSEDEFVQRMEERFERDHLDPEAMTEEQLVQVAREEVAKLPASPLHPDWRMLHLGNGLQPWQWVTANFMHADFMHLAGNMVFLWGIGLVIEGKLGWWRFFLVYLAVGTLGYGLVQLIMLWATPGNALGASLPIYGIMAIALVWAPFNELNCFLWLGRLSRIVDVQIVYFVLGYLALQIAIFSFTGMKMGSEALHLIGAFVGLPIGFAMLLTKMVDCDHWDVFSVWQGKHEWSREKHAEAKRASPEHQAKVANQQAAMLAQIETIVAEQKDPALAWTAHQKMKVRFANWSLPEKTARSILKLYHQQGKKAEAVPAMVEFLRNYPAERTIDARLMLAQYMIREGERPRQGLRLLAKLAPDQLTTTQRDALAKLQQLANKRKQEIELEEPPEDW